MDHELRINAALGKILRNYNFLELNLGLCLRFLENPNNPEASHKYLRRSNLPQIVKRLKKLLVECEHITDTNEFNEWINRSEDIRLLRNYYVHASWQYLPLNDDGKAKFSTPPWRKEKNKGDIEGRMRIKDLEADANRIEAAFKEFMEIRLKYKV